MRRTKRIGILYLILGGMSWGFSGTCGQYLFSQKGISAVWLTSVRSLVAGSILFLVALLTKRQELKKMFTSGKQVLQLIAFALIGLMFSQYAYMTAIANSNSGTATVLQNLNPVLIMMVACILGKRWPRLLEVGCILMAMFGTFLIATHGNPGSLAISEKGLFWGLCCAFATVLYTMIPKRLLENYGSIPVVGSAMVLGGVVFTLATGALQIPVTWDAGTIFGVSTVVIFGSILGFTLFLKGVALEGPVMASIFGSIEPLTATIVSAVWLGTKFYTADLIGFALIIATVIILALKGETSGGREEEREKSYDESR